ncbi:hypothetical protein HK405_003017 [Cladochytrium tenue]|nr:hypothetical protein HK405_003017 [Cladochytrium tenue]
MAPSKDKDHTTGRGTDTAAAIAATELLLAAKAKKPHRAPRAPPATNAAAASAGPASSSSPAVAASSVTSAARSRSKRQSAALADAAAAAGPPQNTAAAGEAAATGAESVADSSEQQPAVATVTFGSIEFVKRRLRSLGKRLIKLEGYENVPKTELNKDQVEALEKKPEVVAVIKELEEILKHLQKTEQEARIFIFLLPFSLHFSLLFIYSYVFRKCLSQEIASIKEREDLELTERNFKVITAVDQAQSAAKASMREVLDLFYVLNTQLQWTRIPLSDNVFRALHKLKACLASPPETTSRDEFLASSEFILPRYCTGSSEAFDYGVTYGDLKAAVCAILIPPPRPKFGSAAASTFPGPTTGLTPPPEAAANSAAAAAGPETTALLPPPASTADMAPPSPPTRRLASRPSFFKRSEILGR